MASVTHSSSGTVLLVDDDPAIGASLRRALQAQHYSVEIAVTTCAAIAQWRNAFHDVLICESRLLDDDPAFLQELSIENVSSQVIILSASEALDSVLHALRRGASDYVLKPVDTTLLSHAVSRCVAESRLIRQNLGYQRELEARNRALQESLRLLKEDQEAGRAVQLKMLPPHQQRFGDIDIAYNILPSLLLSGDFIDFFELNADQIGFYLADVSGHGASSAFITILLKNMANRLKRAFQEGDSDSLGPNQILSVANEELLALGLGKHLAIFCGTINRRSSTLTYCSAAHFPPPLLMNGNKLLPLEGKGLPVGLFDGVEFDEHHVQLSDCFKLIIFSDGVLELMPQSSVAEKEQFLMEMVAGGTHNISDMMRRLGVESDTEMPDDFALMTVMRGFE